MYRCGRTFLLSFLTSLNWFRKGPCLLYIHPLAMRIPLVLPSSQASQRGGISYALNISENYIIVNIEITFYYPIAEDTPMTPQERVPHKAFRLIYYLSSRAQRINVLISYYSSVITSLIIFILLEQHPEYTDARTQEIFFSIRAKQPPACDICCDRAGYKSTYKAFFINVVWFVHK